MICKKKQNLHLSKLNLQQTKFYFFIQYDIKYIQLEYRKCNRAVENHTERKICKNSTNGYVPDKATSKKKLPSSELFLFLSNVVCRLIYNLIIRV